MTPNEIRSLKNELFATREDLEDVLDEVPDDPGCKAAVICAMNTTLENVAQCMEHSIVPAPQKPKRFPRGIKRSPWLDENIMLEAPHVIADTDDCHTRLANLCELIADVDRLHGRPPGDFTHIPLHCPDDEFFRDSENCWDIERELLTYLDEFMPPFAYICHGDDSIDIRADVETAAEDLSQDHAVFDQGVHCTPDEPSEGYHGLWMSITDHGNATLFLRDDRGEDHEIWAVV